MRVASKGIIEGALISVRQRHRRTLFIRFNSLRPSSLSASFINDNCRYISDIFLSRGETSAMFGKLCLATDGRSIVARFKSRF